MVGGRYFLPLSMEGVFHVKSFFFWSGLIYFVSIFLSCLQQYMQGAPGVWLVQIF
jgi:hypothetical protein